MVTTIGIDPHKATHTAVAIDESETVLGEITVAADRYQTKKLIDWASELDGDGCLWAVEAAGGLGYLLFPTAHRWRRTGGGRASGVGFPGEAVGVGPLG